MYTKAFIIAAATILPMATAFSPSMSLSARQATSARLTGACALRSAQEPVSGSPLIESRRGVVAAGLAFLGGAVLPKSASAQDAAAPAAAAPAAAPAPDAPAKAERKPGDKKFTGDYVAGWIPLCILASLCPITVAHALNFVHLPISHEATHSHRCYASVFTSCVGHPRQVASGSHPQGSVNSSRA